MICYKKFFIAILIFLFVFCFTSSVFAANPQPVDPTGSYTTSQGGYSEQRDNVYYTLLEYQANVQRRFISKCYANIDNSSYRPVLVRLYDQFKGLGSNGKFFVFSETYSGYDSSYTVYTSYTGDLSRSVTNQFVIDNTAFSHVATYTGTFYNICGIANEPYVTNPVYSNKVTLTQPVAFCRSLVPEFIQLFKDFGFITDASNDNVVNAINQSNSDITNEIVILLIKLMIISIIMILQKLTLLALPILTQPLILLKTVLTLYLPPYSLILLLIMVEV